jgi:hypothetical protein
MEIRSIAEEVAKCFEDGIFQRSTSTTAQQQQKELPTSITIYHTGRILYSCHNNNNNNTSTNLCIAFDNLITSLPQRYVCDKVLHELHFGYMSMLVSYAKQNTLMNPLAISIDSHSAVDTVAYEDIIEATESLCGIYLASNTACQYCCFGLGPNYEDLELVFVSLSWVYDNYFIVTANNNTNNTRNDNTIDNIGKSNERDILLQQSILHVLSRLLTIGLIIGQAPTDEVNEISGNNIDEQLSSIMTFIQNIQSSLGEYSVALGDMLDLVVNVDNNDNECFSSSMLISKFHNNNNETTPPPQLQYLLAMLRASPRSKKEEPHTTAMLSNTKSRGEGESRNSDQQSPPGVIHSLLDEQIDQIKSILPTLGEGYIEEALKCYNHDVDQTLMALLECASEENSHNNNSKNNNIHPRLLTIPTNLPRKLRSSVDKYSVNVNLHRGTNIQKHNDGKEFITLQKEYIKQNERIAEEESYLIEQISRNLVINESLSALPDTSSSHSSSILIGSDEYNDEYDDQYDGIGDAGGGGVADVGLYDVDNNDYNTYASQKQQQYSRSGGDGGRAYNNEQQMKMKKYNSLIKDITAEGEFWEGNRNTNRGGSINKATKQDGKGDEEEDDDGGGARNRFGLDKGRGGRVIGPDGKYLRNSNSHGRGGGRGRGGEGRGEVNSTSKTPTAETDLSKVQKRKKNDNKSKIGNHHRKDRATKKASGGMII